MVDINWGLKKLNSGIKSVFGKESDWISSAIKYVDTNKGSVDPDYKDDTIAKQKAKIKELEEELLEEELVEEIKEEELEKSESFNDQYQSELTDQSDVIARQKARIEELEEELEEEKISEELKEEELEERDSESFNDQYQSELTYSADLSTAYATRDYIASTAGTTAKADAIVVAQAQAQAQAQAKLEAEKLAAEAEAQAKLEAEKLAAEAEAQAKLEAEKLAAEAEAQAKLEAEVEVQANVESQTCVMQPIDGACEDGFIPLNGCCITQDIAS